jgi:hypothetical protein
MSDLSSFIVRWIRWFLQGMQADNEAEERKFLAFTLVVFTTIFAILVANAVLKQLWGGVFLWGALLIAMILVAYRRRREMSLAKLSEMKQERKRNTGPAEWPIAFGPSPPQEVRPTKQVRRRRSRRFWPT